MINRCRDAVETIHDDHWRPAAGRGTVDIRAFDRKEPAMSTLGNGLPDLPPEWGQVVIPDDPAELATEAESVRRELRREARRSRRSVKNARWRRRLRLPERLDDPENPSLLLPLLVLGIAVLITLLSLVLIAWPSLTRQPPVKVNPGPSVVAPASPVPADRPGAVLTARPRVSTPATPLVTTG
jgi:hypothetical protein